MKEKITFLLPSLEPGGTERNVVNLANAIDQERYQVSVVLGKKEGNWVKELNQHIAIIDLQAPHSVGLFFALVKFLKDNQTSIFISAFPRINIIVLAAKLVSGSNSKIILTEHSVFSMLPIIARTAWRRAFARAFMPLLARILYPKADAIICVSKGIAHDLSKIIGGSTKINVIYNPIINDEIYQLADSPVNHPWFSDPNIPVLLAVGRLVVCKDYPTLLEAFAQVVKIRPAHLVILGSGPERESLERLVAKMGLSNQIAFLGFQKNPYAYMKRASVFVLSSLQEGFGNVIIEAMACGTPVVSTDCPVGPGEIITHGKNGMLVPMADHKALAKAILDMLSSPLLREEFSIAGKARAGSFSVKRGVQEYEKIFHALSVKP